MTITAYEVAAFTNDPRAGSPTGVVLDAGGLRDEQMQAIAQQLGFSHTAFVSEGSRRPTGCRHPLFHAPP